MELNQVTLPALEVAASVKFYRSMGLPLIVDSPHYARMTRKRTPDYPGPVGRDSRTSMRRILLVIAAFLLLPGCGPGEDCPSDAEPARANPQVEVHGALRAVFHQGSTDAQVTLDTVLPNPDLYAVGALADLAGEITIVGGQAYLSYPEGPDASRTEVLSATDAGAALLVVAEVPRWRTLTTARPIRFDELDDAIEKLAVEAGLEPADRIPFLLEGEFEELQWHVIDGERLTGGGGSQQDHLAAAVREGRDRAAATLVGFYSRSDQGVFTHQGSATHLHCVLEEPAASGHVDHVLIPAGTTVRFP